MARFYDKDEEDMYRITQQQQQEEEDEEEAIPKTITQQPRRQQRSISPLPIPPPPEAWQQQLPIGSTRRITQPFHPKEEDESDSEEEPWQDENHRYLPPTRIDGGSEEYVVDYDTKDHECCDLYRNVLLLACFLVILFPSFILWTQTQQDNYPNSTSSPNSNTSADKVRKPLPEAPDNLDELCSYNNLKTTTGYQKCEKACEVADCCEFPTTLDLSCVYGNEFQCLAYHEQCVKLNHPQSQHEQQQQDEEDYPYPDHDLDFENQDDNKAVNQHHNTIPRPPNNLPLLCAHDRLTTADGFAFCRDVCIKGQCCYDKDYDGPSCTEDNPTLCNQYAPCLAMSVLDRIDTSITEEVDQKCSPPNIQRTPGGREECLGVCAHSLCCYAEDIVGPCRPSLLSNSEMEGDTEAFCNQYLSCQNVFDVTQEQIDTLCDAESGDEGTCMHVCFPSRCCFDEGPCFDDVTLGDCDIYQACSRVFPHNRPDTEQPTVSLTPVPSPKDTTTTTTEAGAQDVSEAIIRDACLNHNNNPIPGRQTLCDIVCEPGKCCFEDDDDDENTTNNNHYHPTTTTIQQPQQQQPCHVADCTKYSTCRGNKNQQVRFQDLQDACNGDTIANGDSTRCVLLCVEAACCYTTDPSRSCLETNTNIICSTYEPCDIIYYPQ